MTDYFGVMQDINDSINAGNMSDARNKVIQVLAEIDKKEEEFNPYDPPQHWYSDYPKPPKYEEGSDRGATDEF